MFDDLMVTQKEVATLLQEQIEKNLLPYAMLFSGSKYSGRMHCALELGKALGCSIGDLLVLSSRDQRVLVEAAVNHFEKARNNASRQMLEETLSVLLLQYSGDLASCASTSEKANFALASDISEDLKALKRIKEEEVPSFCKALRLKCSKVLGNCKKSSGVSIAQARLIGKWASDTTSSGKPRLVIIEAIEDANESVKNALLKTLEEPPQNTYFIIISCKSERIMPTILSRLRRYNFKTLDSAGAKALLSSQFRVDPSPYDSLEDFFLDKSLLNIAALKACADGILQGKDVKIRSACDDLTKLSMSSWFFQLLSSKAQGLFQQGLIKYDKAMLINNAIEQYCRNAIVYNQNLSITLTGLMCRIREINSK